MRSILLAGLAAVFAAAAAAAAPLGASTPVSVQIDAGSLQGRLAEGVASFKGVPYARPPVGPWRWRPPQRPDPWTGVRDATAYGPICMQTIVKDNGVGPGPVSEDCLTLNVFSPEGAGRAGGLLPVMVWIHGGGFVNGSGTAALYDGSALARQGVVVVTLNYRLGRFGFFAHPALTEETPKTYLANYGLMDQIAALQWVRRNIAAFGGDAGDVTVFGESAGGMAVNRLMMIREARGLFHKAISESGVGRERGQTLAEAEADGAAFAAKLGVKGGSAAALRALDAGAIQSAGALEVFKGEAPILDGRLLVRDPIDAFGRGEEAPVPYLVGSNSLEIPEAFASPAMKARVQPHPEAMAAVAAGYGSPELMKERLVTDVLFGEPARTLARDHAISGAPTYLYRFSVVSSGAPPLIKGAVHASDRQYVFQTLSSAPWPADARDAALAKTISAYWVAFAKTGDPNGPDRPVWPRYGSRDEIMDFTNAGPERKVTPDAAALDALANSYGASTTAR